MSETSRGLFGVWASRGAHEVYAGRGVAPKAARVASLWREAGWKTRISGGAPRGPLRPPYDPLLCEYCSWGGINLGTHHARSHPILPTPEGPLVTEAARVQAQSARETQDRNRRPRSGLLMVRDEGTRVVVYRIIRVSSGTVEFRPVNQSEPEAHPESLPVSQVLSDFRPVGRWVGN